MNEKQKTFWETLSQRRHRLDNLVTWYLQGGRLQQNDEDEEENEEQ